MMKVVRFLHHLVLFLIDEVVRMEFIYSTWEGMFAWLNKLAKKNASQYCELESAYDDITLINKDGSLSTVFEVCGVSQMVSEEEYLDISDRLTLIFSPLLKRKGMILKCFFRYDDAMTKEDINKILSPAKACAKRVDLDFKTLFSYQEKSLSKRLTTEKCYLVLWTSPQIISSFERKTAYKEKGKKFKNKSLKISASAQHFLHVLREVQIQHIAAIDTIIDAMKMLKIRLEVQSVHEALAIIKHQLFPITADDWQAALPCDAIYPKASTNEWSKWLWPSLSDQLMDEPAENVNLSECIIGEYRYAPISMILFPKNIQPFYRLFSSLRECDIPWQCSFTLLANGVKISQSKALIAQFLTFSSHENKLIMNAHKLLKHINENSDKPVVSLSISFMTWAKEDDVTLLKKRKAAIIRAVQSWGGSQVTQSFGDPFDIVMGQMVAMKPSVFPGAVGAPILDAIKLMPFFRPACVWDQGSVVFSTPDGKAWPYQSGSCKQVSWVELIYARSGSGKSVLLNSLNLAACLSQGIDALPYITILDIGSSAKGLVDLIKSTSNIQDVAEFYRFQFSVEDAINPFDTHLGARFPSSSHRAFLTNFLMVLMLENLSYTLPEGMETMLTLVLDKLYTRFTDNEEPKLYQQGIDTNIDELVQKYFHAQRPSTWWQVVDKLFDQGDTIGASIAQRYAMPLLSDLIISVNHSSILDLYQNVEVGNGENFISYFCRNITTSIKRFPAINIPTSLSVRAKIAVFDLMSVMSSASSSDERVGVLAYMIVRHATSNYFFINAKDLTYLDSRYIDFHAVALKAQLNIPKRIVFDEFHRCNSCAPIVRQVITDMREGRKQNVQITLASQSVDDFSDMMLSFATSIFILSGGNQGELNKIVNTFGLNNTEKHALKTYVHGPSRQGMNFIGQFYTTNGISTQLLNLSLSAYELWIFTTTAEDVYLRDLLIEKIGFNQTLQHLADAFPFGSAKSYVALELKKNPELTMKQVLDQYVKAAVGSEDI
ncbi:hypothetical protein IB691_09025, partial [Fangia hongkongensis]|nr:hypothetical protein [Fangia hongkongensis]